MTSGGEQAASTSLWGAGALLKSLAPQLRTIAGLGAFIPVAAGSVAVGLATQSKRHGVNFFTENWPKLMLTMGGVEINVVGSENLAESRPALFVFNHRNNFDFFVTAALVRDNWTTVGKKELQREPIAGTIGKIVDAAFIDRNDPLAAVEGLRKVEDLARQGLSIIISPEGTRTETNTVGPFKKGPFRIAMTASIPVVPVVIRNAETIVGRHSTVLQPGVVDVAVLPPIPVDTWTLQDLEERIADVRELFVETLTAWPGRGAESTTP